jgi:hypothetical protein
MYMLREKGLKSRLDKGRPRLNVHNLLYTRWKVYHVTAIFTSSGVRINLVGLDGLHILVGSGRASVTLQDLVRWHVRVDRDGEPPIPRLSRRKQQQTGKKKNEIQLFKIDSNLVLCFSIEPKNPGSNIRL